MCGDIENTLPTLTAKGVEVSQPVTNAAWGSRASIRLPSGSDLPLCQPRHPAAYDLDH
jgi:hypothetical protein